ncbi:MAG: segregation/condensation protein A [Ignavibacteriae bacterium]|nr:segregation/condensation protein A [Ignavibacteriota bacterium]
MYKVKLQTFEGPLDLLLFFIKRDELDIYDIPIARITREFLEYLHLLQELDLEIAGDFIVMAAELMQIKVRMLLPRDEGVEEEEDPRAELVRRLLEYKRFKEASLAMQGLEFEQSRYFYRQGFHADPKLISIEDQEASLKDITMFNLIAAFRKVLDRIPKKLYHDVEMMNVTIDEQMSYIADVFRMRDEIGFIELVEHMTEKIRIIVTIIAMLEMVKQRFIGLKPSEHEDDFIVYKIKEEQPVGTADSTF